MASISRYLAMVFIYGLLRVLGYISKGLVFTRVEMDCELHIFEILLPDGKPVNGIPISAINSSEADPDTLGRIWVVASVWGIMLI